MDGPSSGHRGDVRPDPRFRPRRPAGSWPATLLPGALVLALVAGTAPQGGSADDPQDGSPDHPVVDMTVTGILGR
jgi:hypothetical protein